MNNDDFKNEKINFIQNHIKSLLNEIVNLPKPWSYGVDNKGRIFFINDDLKSTTWLHPITQKPASVMLIPPLEDLPQGCEKDSTYGVPYYIDHNQRITSFDLNDVNSVKNQRDEPIQVKFSIETDNENKDQKLIRKMNNKFSGYLYKLNAFKFWKKRYFVLNDYVLDYYSDEKMNKHCGTIFLNDTITSLCVKKDGTTPAETTQQILSCSAKKFSFKIEWKNEKNKKMYLACDSIKFANDWISIMNYVSQNNSTILLGNTLTKTPKSIIKNTNKNSNTFGSNIIVNDNNNNLNKLSGDSGVEIPISKNYNRSNSAPSSPTPKPLNLSNQYQRRDNDGFKGSVNSLYKQPDQFLMKNNKRSSSVGKASGQRTPFNGSYSSNLNLNDQIDHKSIYDAFEKPLQEFKRNSVANPSYHKTHNSNSNYVRAQDVFENRSNNDFNQSYLSEDAKRRFKSEQNLVYKKNEPQQNFYPEDCRRSAVQKSQILFARPAANRESELKAEEIKKNLQLIENDKKSIKVTIENFYDLNKQQLELLPNNELTMLIRQLRRNYTLLNYSNQRFKRLLESYEPYEIVYQQQMMIARSNTDPHASISLLTYLNYMHESYQAAKDRIKKIDLKIDIIESCIDNALKCEATKSQLTSAQPISLLNNEEEFNKRYSLNNVSINENERQSHLELIKLFEYQIVEMKHEYELLLEDKLIVEKLIDNQLRIFSQHSNLSNEQALIQQFNALKNEVELLKMQLNKVNQLLNDTISEKCKNELSFQMIEKEIQERVMRDKQRRSRLAASQNVIIEPTLNTNLNPMQQFRLNNYFHSSQHNLAPTEANKQTNASSLLTNFYDKSAQSFNSSVWKQPNNNGRQKSPNGTVVEISRSQENLDRISVDSRSRERSRNLSAHKSRSNFSRDSVGEKRRASIGRLNGELNVSNTNLSSIEKGSAHERLFGSQKNLDQVCSGTKKVAVVAPEVKNDDDLVKFSERTQIEYFETHNDICEKSFSKPEILALPDMYFDKEFDLNENRYLVDEWKKIEVFEADFKEGPTASAQENVQVPVSKINVEWNESNNNTEKSLKSNKENLYVKEKLFESRLPKERNRPISGYQSNNMKQYNYDMLHSIKI